MGLSRSDLEDIDFIDAYELRADGYQNGTGFYLESTLIDTISETNLVSINLPISKQGIFYKTDHPAQPGDYVWIFGTSGENADGYYTINNVLSNTTFTTIENLNNSMGGFIKFFYSSGASKVGVDNSKFNNISASNVQIALEQIDKIISSNISLPIATSCGQLLISEEDNVFKPNYPMIGDNSGYILMGDNGKMIICG